MLANSPVSTPVQQISPSLARRAIGRVGHLRVPSADIPKPQPELHTASTRNQLAPTVVSLTLSKYSCLSETCKPFECASATPANPPTLHDCGGTGLSPTIHHRSSSPRLASLSRPASQALYLELAVDFDPRLNFANSPIHMALTGRVLSAACAKAQLPTPSYPASSDLSGKPMQHHQRRQTSATMKTYGTMKQTSDIVVEQKFHQAAIPSSPIPQMDKVNHDHEAAVGPKA